MATVQKRLSVLVMPAWLRIVGGLALLAAVMFLPDDGVAGRIFYGSVALTFVCSGIHHYLKTKAAPLWIQNLSAIIGYTILLVLIVSFAVDWWSRH